MPDLSDSDHRYHFGEFTLDTRRGELLHRRKPIKIRAQSFQVLLFLLQRHGSLVSKAELHDAIWGNKVVSDDSLTHCLLDIRKAIGDTNKSIVRTVPRRGYLFEGSCEIEKIDDRFQLSAKTFSGRQSMLLAATMAAVVLVAAWILKPSNGDPDAVMARSIAVLPFVDQSPDQNQTYLSDGLSDDVLNLLARSPELTVIARSSSFSFADDEPSIVSVRDALHVAFVLEGSLRREDDTLVVFARLIATDNGRDVWSHTYDGQPQDIMTFQRQIADSVLAIVAPDAEEFLFTAQPRNFSAEEFMYLAQSYEQVVRDKPEVDTEKLQAAVELYQDAIDAEPRSALAHSRLAGALLYAGDVAAARIPMETAVELNPHLSEVQETLGEYYWLSGEIGAGKAWLRAIELNGSNADALSNYAYWYWMQGNDDGPEELFRRALRIDPLSLSRHAALGDYYGHQGNVEATNAVIRRIRNNFDSAKSDRVVSRLLELTGKLDESIAWTIKARDREPGNPDHVSALAELYAEIGDFKTALQLEPDPGVGLLYKMGRFQELIDKAEIQIIDEPNDASLRYLLAFSYGAVGDNTNALRSLRYLGQPNYGHGETRQPIHVEGFVAYVDALDGLGQSDEANELADWFHTNPHTESTNWWIHVHRACALAIMGRDSEALDRLERVAESPRLPWRSKITGQRCLQRFKGEPRFEAAVATIEARRDVLRGQLATTLRSHDVAL